MSMYFLLLLISLLTSACQSQTKNQYSLNGQAQGTTWHLTYYAADSLIAKESIDSLFRQVDSSLSLYLPNSLINRLNRSDAGIIMDQHLAVVVERAIEVWKDTEGIFDMTILPLVNLWGFGVAGKKSVPDSAAVSHALRCVGTEKVSITKNILSKQSACVQLDLNGIAQGYTVDLLAAFLESAGINNYIIELGGEIRVKGRKPEGALMRIGIETPGSEDHPGVFQHIVSMESGAITSSGNYRRFYETGGTRISHIIDPRSGYPARNELISVTIIAEDAITADAYDNMLMVLGLKAALRFVNSRPWLAAHFIYRDEAGNVRDTVTAGFAKFLVE